MRKLSACLMAAVLSAAPASALAGPGTSGRDTPWEHVESFEWSSAQPRLGIMVMQINPELRSYFGAPTDRGVLVARIEPGSPAAKAGLKVGDVIVTVKNAAVDDADDIVSALADTKAGDKVKIQLVRDKHSLSIDATMLATKASEQATASPHMTQPPWFQHMFPWLDDLMARRADRT